MFTVASPKDYLLASLLVAAVTLLGELLESHLAPSNLLMFYLLSVVLAAQRAGRGPAAFCAGLSVLAFDFFFVPPRYTFAVSQKEYLLTFAALLVVALVVGDLTARVQAQVQELRQRQLHVTAAYALSRELARAGDQAAIVEALVRHLPRPGRVILDAEAPTAHELDLLLRQGDRELAILRIEGPLTPNDRQLTETLGNLAALAFERVRLAEEARRAMLLEESERLQSILLNSLSHDLQTPLTSILGSLDGLLDPIVQSDEAVRATLLQSAREQTERLRRLVDDLLEMSRVESRQAGLHKERCDLSDLVGSALGRLEEAYRNRDVILEVAPDFPLIPVDFVPFSQVLYNLLENAAKYSPAGSAVEVSARLGRGAEVRISDRGPGIPASARERVFEKFFRLSDQVPGTGLGLPICRGLMELHGGSIRVEERPGGGATFVLEIPA